MDLQMTKIDQPSLVLITGASTGIGYALAEQFVMHGHDIIIVSKSDKIYEAALDLRQYGQSVYEFKYDLAQRGDIQKFYKAVKNLKKKINIAVFNAGVGVGGDFRTTDMEEEINLINLNVMGTVHLTKLLVTDLIPDNGKLLFTSSVVSDMPASFQAVYGASKAFIKSFANALREELKHNQISVTVLMPGATNTNFFHRAGMENTKLGMDERFENNAEDVARQGYEALMAGKQEVFAASAKTKVQGMVNKFLPEKVKGYLHRKLAEPGSLPS